MYTIPESQPATDAILDAALAGTVLVVDDEEANRDLIRDTLEARGYRVLARRGAGGSPGRGRNNGSGRRE